MREFLQLAKKKILNCHHKHTVCTSDTVLFTTILKEDPKQTLENLKLQSLICLCDERSI